MTVIARGNGDQRDEEEQQRGLKLEGINLFKKKLEIINKSEFTILILLVY